MRVSARATLSGSLEASRVTSRVPSSLISSRWAPSLFPVSPFPSLLFFRVSLVGGAVGSTPLLLVSLNSTHVCSWHSQFDPDIPNTPRGCFVFCLKNDFLLFVILYQHTPLIVTSGFNQHARWIEWANPLLPISISLLSQSNAVFTAGSVFQLFWDAVCEWHVRKSGDVFCCFSAVNQCPDDLITIDLGVSFLTHSVASATFGFYQFDVQFHNVWADPRVTSLQWQCRSSFW